MLCSKCQIVSQNIHDLLQAAADPVPEFCSYASNYSALKVSGAHGCDFCRLLVQCAVDQLEIDQIIALSPEQESLSFKVDIYHAAGQYCMEAVTFYFGYSDNPFLVRNFQLSFRVELVQSPGKLLLHYFNLL